MSSVIPRPEGPSEKRIPLVSETHSLEITGKQVNLTGIGLVPVRQQPGTADTLLNEGLITGGRYGAPISCGKEDTHVSRQAISASICGRELSFECLG